MSENYCTFRYYSTRNIENVNDVAKIFTNSSAMHFITIKPRNTLSQEKVDKQLIKYLSNKPFDIWLEKCISPSGFNHYHGIIAYNQRQVPKGKERAAFYKMCNRSIGFLKSEPMETSYAHLFNYIKSPDNAGKTLISSYEHHN